MISNGSKPRRRATSSASKRGPRARKTSRGWKPSSATKDDFARFEAATKDDFARLEATTASKEDLARFEAATKDEFARLEATTASKEDLARLEAQSATKNDLERLRAELYRALWIQGAGIIAIVAALKFLP